MSGKTITIPEDLYKKAEEFIKKSGTEFKSVDDLVTFILQEFLSEEGEALTPEEEEKIRERLRALGYI